MTRIVRACTVILRTRVVPALLAFVVPAAVALAAPPTPGPLAFLPGDDALAGAAGDQSPPELARGADRMLAVWSDARAAEGAYDVYGALLDAAGNPLGASFAIDDGDGSQTGPRVAWNGQHFLVAYLDGARLVAARVASDGTVLDAPPIAVSTPGSDAAFTLASDGSSWALLWAGRAAGQADLRGARISAAGTVLDPGGVPILPETWFVRSVGPMAFSQNRYFMVWTDDSGVVALRLTPALQKLDAGPIVVAGSAAYFEKNASVAANASEFFVTWTETDNSYWVDQIKGTRVSPAGVAAIPAGAPINENVSGGGGADVTWDGTQWIVAWTGAGVFANRVSAQGVVLDGTGFQLASATGYQDARGAAVAAAPGGGAKVVWQDYRSHLENDVWGAPVRASGGGGPDALVGLAAPAQQNPKVVWNGGGYTVAFLSRTSTRSRVLVQRLDAAGVPIDAPPVEVAAGTDLVEPGLAWSGSRYLVTWRVRSTVRVQARRLAADLAFQDAAPFEVMTGYNPSVSALGDTFLVVAENSPSYYQWRDVYAQRVAGATGTKLGGLIGLPGGFAWGCTVGTIGHRWLVAWEAHYAHNDSQYTLSAAWVDADGTLGPSFGLVWGVGWGTAGVKVAGHPQLGAIVYSTSRLPSASNGEIYLMRVRADGTFVDGYTGLLVTGNAPAEQYVPAACWNGVEFVTAYQDSRASAPFLASPKSDVYASRVAADGTVLDVPGGFPVESTPASESQPAVAGADGATLVAASHVRGGAFGAPRVGVRLLVPADAPPGAVAGLRFDGPASLAWDAGKAAIVYDVLRGDLAALAADRSIAGAACFADDVPSPSAVDAAEPGAGAGFYYLVRADRAGGGAGTYDDPQSGGLAHGRDDDVGPGGCTHVP